MMNRGSWKIALGAVVILLAGVAAGCGGSDGSSGESGAAAEPAVEQGSNAPDAEGEREVSGSIDIDGSSTVAPLTTLAAEEFMAENSAARITVGISGTGGGFERFCRGETDLSNASRPIKDEEAAECESNGVEFVEFRVATDALTVVVNSGNDWIECLTLEQLATIWAPAAEGSITSWVDVDPSFPDEPLVLAGPGTDSGTFDYFTEVVNGEGGASRADYTASEDDNVIVRAVDGALGGTGYFGFSYFAVNPDALRAVPIDGGEGCVEPSIETALSGEYTPLARPLFVYASVASFETPVVREFMRFYLENERELAETALFVPLSDEQHAQVLDAFEPLAP